MSPSLLQYAEQFEDEEEILNGSSLSEEQKKLKLTRILRRASSNGDGKRVNRILSIARPYIDLDGQDDDGTNPLIYASCFGYLDVVFALLQAGANPNAQDKSGWTALMWATNNHHDAIVCMLVEHGASTTSKSATGRTVMDFVNHGINQDPIQNRRIAELLSDVHENKTERKPANRISAYYNSSRKELGSIIAETDILYKMAMNNVNGNEMDLANFRINDSGEVEGNFEEFVWDHIQPDQIFVFSPTKLPSLLNKVISRMKPHYTPEHKFIPANVLFLAARYAHSLVGPELLDELLSDTVRLTQKVVQVAEDDMSLLAFWISNCTLLLYYLKRDGELSVQTLDRQVDLSELVEKTYRIFVRGVQQKIEEVIESAMLSYDTLPGLNEVKFAGEKRRFFFPCMRSTTPNSTIGSTGSNSQKHKRRVSQRATILPRQKPASPRTINCILSSTLIVLQTYEVHPNIIHSTLNQLLHFVSGEMFNSIITQKEYCSRYKAIQIRMNLSVIEEWVLDNKLPKELNENFQDLRNLLQLIQCLSQQTDLLSFTEMMDKMEYMNLPQILMVVRLYNYEVDEVQLPESLSTFLLDLVEKEKVGSSESSPPPAGDGSDPSIPSSANGDAGPVATTTATADDTAITAADPSDAPPGPNRGVAEMEELKDPEKLLPFTLPTLAEMLSGWGREEFHEYVPFLPEDFLRQVDEEFEN
ncbi:hypothetical protein K493DRAFT_289435 [Basidiobolus meristosporus CBS 931.73]|uniref:Dilute domain-containing protein n=1 Tax=Basidiobolus meristosporus CBS 931.73 TaxID=1314790 RepID=A0A1Y1XUG7_9FUNG|nr:hypothetical protein K493DRAFT_289435 [Basidiobolus meristosporus CBS 931.73]|eukprot:ORX89399.1 hypothetical protein K493DRAFT_289435 [Basidiobolus meristosporus CBS 931.73]